MNKLFKISALACALTVGFTACDKDDKNPEEVEQEYQAKVMVKDGETKDLANVSTTVNTEGTIHRSGDVYALRNFRQFTIGENGSATETAATNFYFDFKENDGVDAANSPLILPATTAAKLIANADKGYTLYYIDKAFEEVSPNDDYLPAAENTLGLQSAYAPNVIGWASYTGGPKHQVIPVENRTIVIFKDGKAFFKLRVNSVYSNGEPEKEEAPTNYFYYSIDYQEFK
ncbi:hypothetical protein [Sphingobacterium lumbrici]|uniref:hypothetical protein n=1 Tax=Sphingobacterium lumbrici TaxID=2559600 RepID=UPI0011269563|nr:hypothetical protein [Sphingobacterium lumbrici]